MTPSPAEPPPLELWTRRLAVLLLVIATLAVYANSFGGPFIFDDFSTIVENPTIRQLWPLSDVLSPPSNSGVTVNGRPLVNLSLALNYTIGGIDPRGYHVFNVVAHILTGLVLFGVIRHTLRQPKLRNHFSLHATTTALGISVIWLLHPLQTAAVTYIVQRAEVLVSLFYLLTLYAFIRSTNSGHKRLWQSIAIVACPAGMATKEVMVSAPLIVLLYDRTFIAGSFQGALRTRWRFYACLMSTWLLLGYLMLQSGGRGGTAGFGMALSSLDYAITQIGAVTHYLRLTIWPEPLVFDYGGTVLIKSFHAVWPQAVLLLVLLAATLWALRRNHAAGFAGACFFAILSPSSSIVPVADTMFEHRMYLPLAAVISIAGLSIMRWFNLKALVFLSLIAVACGFATAHRNRVYQSELALWTDTIEKRPENVRAHYTLGSVLAAQNRFPEALAEYQRALELKPDSFETHNNLGNLLTRAGQLDEARQHYERALQIRPNSADAHNNLGNALLQSGRAFQAMEHYQAALRLDPSLADAHNNLANFYMRLGEHAAAITHYEAALRARAGFFDAHLNLANALAESGNLEGSLAHYEEALALNAKAADAHYNYGVTLERLGRSAVAAVQYEQTLRLAPNHHQARARLEHLRANDKR